MNKDQIIDAQQIMIDKLASMLQWYVDTDEVNESDPENEYWTEGKHAAIKLLDSLL